MKKDRRMVFYVSGLQRNACKNVDERKIIEERAQFCSLDRKKQQILFFVEYKIITNAVKIRLELEEIGEGDG